MPPLPPCFLLSSLLPPRPSYLDADGSHRGFQDLTKKLSGDRGVGSKEQAEEERRRGGEEERRGERGGEERWCICGQMSVEGGARGVSSAPHRRILQKLE
eukprot:768636-Hanusia_phi.AAC.3